MKTTMSKHKDKKPRDARDLILQLFKDSKNKKLSFKQIKKKLSSKFPVDVLHDTVTELEHDKLLERKGTAFVQQGEKNKLTRFETTLTGILELNQSGVGFVTIEGYEKDIRIQRRNVGSAFTGDKVRIVLTETRKGSRTEGRVVEIIERNTDYITGVIEITDRTAFVIPDNKSYQHDFYVPSAMRGEAKDGDKVVVRFVQWSPDEKNPVAEVVDILGKAGEHDTEMNAILIDNGFRLEFPEAVMKECGMMSDLVSEDEMLLRRDIRTIPTFTIDPYDAKDFDDALSFRELQDGVYEIGIHIADVSHYVIRGSETDLEAQKRATSVYMVDRVIPMLPERLSNELCSLRPNEDKRCFSVMVQMNEKGKVLDEWFGKTLIHSIQRFTYEEAQEVLEGKAHALSSTLLTLNKLAYKLRERRYKDGAINFETVEVKFKLDENNKPIGVYVKERKDAHMLIEDFMLLANRLVAEFVSKKKRDGAPVPFVYRIHDLPDMTKLEDLRDTAAVFGYKLNYDTPRQIAESFNKMMKDLKGKPEQNMLESLAIRTMAKAVYATENIGHYGLAFKHYSHFTSPIRRYPDVLAHRILFDVLYGAKHKKYPQLEELCKHSSDMEKSAADAERMSVKYKQVEFMLSRVGQTFDALITGVTEWGVFAEVIENKCEGLIKLSMLGDERFELDPKAHAVVGMETGTTYSLGDQIKIKVLKANMDKRQLDYAMVYDVEDDD